MPVLLPNIDLYHSEVYNKEEYIVVWQWTLLSHLQTTLVLLK